MEVYFSVPLELNPDTRYCIVAHLDGGGDSFHGVNGKTSCKIEGGGSLTFHAAEGGHGNKTNLKQGQIPGVLVRGGDAKHRAALRKVTLSNPNPNPNPNRNLNLNPDPNRAGHGAGGGDAALLCRSPG